MNSNFGVSLKFLFAFSFFISLASNAHKGKFTYIASPPQISANGIEVSQVTIRTDLKQKKLYLSADTQGIKLSVTTLSTDKFGQAKFSITASTEGRNRITVYGKLEPKIKNPLHPRNRLGMIQISALAPLVLNSPALVFPSQCVTLTASGGVPFKKGAPYLFSLVYSTGNSMNLVGGKLCVDRNASGIFQVTVQDSRNNTVQKSIQVVQNLYLSSSYPFLKDVCTKLVASGGVPRSQDPKYDFFQILENGTQLRLDSEKYCPSATGPILLEVRDTVGNVNRKNFEVYLPLVIENNVLYKGCTTIQVSGGLGFDEAPYYNLGYFLPDGNIEWSQDAQICNDNLGETVRVVLMDASGQRVEKDLTVFTPPPLPITVADIDKYDLYDGHCSNFTINGNRGLTIRYTKDPTGGYWNSTDYDVQDDTIVGSYCAGSGQGTIELAFYDDDNAETFVLRLNALGKEPLYVYADYLTLGSGQ